MRRIYCKYYICYTFGFIILSLHFMLRYSIPYSELQSESSDSMFPRESLVEAGDKAVVAGEYVICHHQRHLQQNLQQGETSLHSQIGPDGSNKVNKRPVSHIVDAFRNTEEMINNNPNFNQQHSLNQVGKPQQTSPTSFKFSQGDARDTGILSSPAVSGDQWRQSYMSPHHITDQEQRGMTFTCSNVDQITIKRKLGQGVTKQVYLGQFGGSKVAVKMITRNVIDVTSCLKKLKRNFTGYSDDDLPKEKHRCYTMPNLKLMKEILLLHQIEHPNLLKLLGYCSRSEETESTSLQDHGVLAVYEYAIPFYPSTLSTWPWYLRAKTAFELADLLHYLQNSPLGSLRISDFKDIHFLLKDGRIKLTDLDDMTSLEPKCKTSLEITGDLPFQSKPVDKSLPGQQYQQFLEFQKSNIDNLESINHKNENAQVLFMSQNQLAGSQLDQSKEMTCGYNLKCIGGICPGFNAHHNLAHMNRIYFQNLLYGDCEDHGDQCAKLRTRLNKLDIDAAELKELLYQLMRVPFVPGYT